MARNASYGASVGPPDHPLLVAVELVGVVERRGSTAVGR